MKPSKYIPIETEDPNMQDGSSVERASSSTFTKTPRRFQLIHIVVLIQSVLLLLNCTLLVKTWSPVNLRSGSFQTGWRDTELHAAFNSIKMHRVTISQPSDQSIGPPQSKYVGEPPEELDNAWRILVAPTILDLNDNEIGSYAGQTTKTEFGWTSGLQVYHNLHCINALRRAVDQHSYGAPSRGELYHLDHCLDMLRLGAQCQSDLTPMLYFNYNDTMGIKPHEHTCCGDDTECAIMLGKQVGAER